MKMDASMKVYGKTAFVMAKHLNDTQMETAIMVSLSKEKHMAKEFILGQTVKFMMVSGLMG